MGTPKKWFTCLIFVWLLVPLAQVGAKSEKRVELAVHKVDISGDGQRDTITLYGVPFGKNTKYYKEFVVTVKNTLGKTSKNIPGGFKPVIQFMDLNSDKQTEIMMVIPNGGSGGSYEYFGYSYQNQKLEEIDLPKPLNINGSFNNNYKATIMIPEMNESHTLDLRMKKKKYDKLGIYRNGKLNEPSETLISEFTSLRTKDLDKDGEMELVGLQSVSGASTTDVIAKVQSIWTFKNKEFQLKRIMLIPC